MKLIRLLIVAAIAVVSTASFSFEAIPNASAKNLKAQAGKEIKTGIVFVNGKYIPAPYKVERWGTGIRINGNFVSGQIVPWNEFLKTQSGVKVIKSEGAAAASDDEGGDDDMGGGDDDDLWGDDGDDEMSALDDLFDDEPKPKKTAKKSTPKKKKAPKKPSVKVTYKLEGEFVMNDACNTLLKKINKERGDIDLHLRRGGMICFGDKYSRVMMDKAPAVKLLAKLPELQQSASSADDVVQGLRKASFSFLPQDLCVEFYKNRTDYFNLRKLRDKLNRSNDISL